MNISKWDQSHKSNETQRNPVYQRFKFKKKKKQQVTDFDQWILDRSSLEDRWIIKKQNVKSLFKHNESKDSVNQQKYKQKRKTKQKEKEHRYTKSKLRHNSININKTLNPNR